jgi:hypothetical protein
MKKNWTNYRNKLNAPQIIMGNELLAWLTNCIAWVPNINAAFENFAPQADAG